MLYESIEDRKDLWLVYELCPGKTLTEHCFEVKGEFYHGERLYKVHHGSLYHRLRTDQALVRDLVARMCDALGVLARLSIVHADLKSDNIIVDYC
jgi:serine/threonine protein kinase